MPNGVIVPFITTLLLSSWEIGGFRLHGLKAWSNQTDNLNIPSQALVIIDVGQGLFRSTLGQFNWVALHHEITLSAHCLNLVPTMIWPYIAIT